MPHASEQPASVAIVLPQPVPFNARSVGAVAVPSRKALYVLDVCRATEGEPRCLEPPDA